MTLIVVGRYKSFLLMIRRLKSLCNRIAMHTCSLIENINKNKVFFDALIMFFFDDGDDIDIVFKTFADNLITSLILYR